MRIAKIVGISLIGLLVFLGACGSPAATTPAAPVPVATTPAAPAPVAATPATPAPAAATPAALAPAVAPAPAPAPVAAPVQEGFTVSKLTMMESVTSGSNMTISFVVTNTGKERGTYTANLKFNDAIVKTQDVTLDSGSSKTVEMAVMTGECGVVKVSLDQLTGKFEVMACDV